jgi:hypothetical protein
VANLNESEMALFPECTAQCSSKGLDTADIVRDGDFTPTIRWDRFRVADNPGMSPSFSLSVLGTLFVHALSRCCPNLEGLRYLPPSKDREMSSFDYDASIAYLSPTQVSTGRDQVFP